MELLEELVDTGELDPAKLMPGTGTCSLADAIVLTKHAVDLGCGGVLMLPPFYYKAPSEDGLFRFFAETIEEVGDDRLKVYLYHIPPVAQVGFSLPLIGRLIKEFPNIVVGLKDSSGDWSNTAAILATYPGFEVFPGSEIFLLDGLRKGAAGCISATCNVSAAAIRHVYDNWQGPEADKLQADITALRKAIQAFPMIPALKALIAHYRQDPGWAKLRPPFVGLSTRRGGQGHPHPGGRARLQARFRQGRVSREGVRPDLSKRVPRRVRREADVADVRSQPQADAGANGRQDDAAVGDQRRADAADEIGRSVDAGEGRVDAHREISAGRSGTASWSRRRPRRCRARARASRSSACCRRAHRGCPCRSARRRGTRRRPRFPGCIRWDARSS